MTKATAFKQLSAVRGALRGWAFAHPDWLPGMVAHAEAEAAKLPAALQAEAAKLIAPVRDAASRIKAVARS